MKKNLSVLWEKKSKCPKKNFQSVKKGKIFKYRISGVRKKKIWKKSSEKRFLGGNFTKFVFTGWVFPLICKFELQEKGNFQSVFRLSIWS